MTCAARLFINLALLALLVPALASAQSQQVALQLDPAKTQVRFTLDATLHSVHGTFHAQVSELEYDAASGKLSGEILLDAKSGETGNGMRDRKMHTEVLESARYPEISFRPDRVEGAVANPGKSSVKVYGVFRIHGVEQELTVPAEVEMSSGSWTATAHFTVPYAKWGMKNPSTFFLHVSDSVEIEVTAAGSVQSRATNASAPQ
ncbi:MAG TPA: YceI family protein [Candidatus Acidoferrales bacterium]|nr:YceI family protein [Candidatus Acidoferrales bacterium]